jgi:DNA (cytosine-5)-methyltransferase 1
MNAIDLFSGAGGWDIAAARLGVHPLGIEQDPDAIATARAAGHRVHEGDVAALDPADFAPCDLLIASPPCQAWSLAGKGGGQRDIKRVYALTNALAAGSTWTDDGGWADKRSRLVCEPLRWALALEPRWIALEQVPPVLDYWRHLADVLRERGYSCWAGILECERFGVPQTRERAILMADRDAPVCPPRPTHQRYVPGEPQRHEHTLEGEVLPWVSMAEALGWGMTARPTHTVTGGGTGSGGGVEVFASDDVRAIVERERDAGRWEMRSNMGVNPKGGNVPRRADLPAATITGLQGRMDWVLRGHQSIAGEGRAERATQDPALTVSTRSDLWSWVHDRPSTTVNADPRISHPGRHDPEESGSQQRDAIRVTVEEAATLQSFPAGYPWQGSRSSQFRQVGNAIPPGLAEAVLRALVAP